MPCLARSMLGHRRRDSAQLYVSVRGRRRRHPGRRDRPSVGSGAIPQARQPTPDRRPRPELPACTFGRDRRRIAQAVGPPRTSVRLIRVTPSASGLSTALSIYFGDRLSRDPADRCARRDLLGLQWRARRAARCLQCAPSPRAADPGLVHGDLPEPQCGRWLGQPTGSASMADSGSARRRRSAARGLGLTSTRPPSLRHSGSRGLPANAEAPGSGPHHARRLGGRPDRLQRKQRAWSPAALAYSYQWQRCD